VWRACYGRARYQQRYRQGCIARDGSSQQSGLGGGLGWSIIDNSTDPPRLDGDYVRDEAEQVRYMEELSAIFAEEGVDLVFWFTFTATAWCTTAVRAVTWTWPPMAWCDYILFHGISHSWEAKTDCVVLGIRWPSLPGYQRPGDPQD
jgi:hypothetical protein